VTVFQPWPRQSEKRFATAGRLKLTVPDAVPVMFVAAAEKLPSSTIVPVVPEKVPELLVTARVKWYGNRPSGPDKPSCVPVSVPLTVPLPVEIDAVPPGTNVWWY
jgi:hypothetical protein